jgi:hypothetical protein
LLLSQLNPGVQMECGYFAKTLKKLEFKKHKIAESSNK